MLTTQILMGLVAQACKESPSSTANLLHFYNSLDSGDNDPETAKFPDNISSRNFVQTWLNYMESSNSIRPEGFIHDQNAKYNPIYRQDYKARYEFSEFKVPIKQALVGVTAVLNRKQGPHTFEDVWTAMTTFFVLNSEDGFPELKPVSYLEPLLEYLPFTSTAAASRLDTALSLENFVIIVYMAAVKHLRPKDPTEDPLRPWVISESKREAYIREWPFAWPVRMAEAYQAATSPEDIRYLSATTDLKLNAKSALLSLHRQVRQYLNTDPGYALKVFKYLKANAFRLAYLAVREDENPLGFWGRVVERATAPGARVSYEEYDQTISVIRKLFDIVNQETDLDVSVSTAISDTPSF